MSRILFITVVILHAIIHLLGFIKAFGLMEVSQLSSAISKPAGLLWLLTTLLFITGMVLYVTNTDTWPEVLLLAVVLSQILIFMVWSDAKFGTLPNILIVLIALPALGSIRFDKKVLNEQREFLESVNPLKGDRVTSAELNSLPSSVRKWLNYTGVVGKPEIAFVRVKQSGKMKTKTDGNWMPFTAIQYVNPPRASFIWKAKVKMMPLIYLQGRDRLQNAKGEMQIRVLGGFNVVNESDNPKINTGAMIRFLGEMCWYPSAVLSNYVRWQELSPLSARATLTWQGVEVSGIFNFNEDGSLKSFEADRYFGGDENARLEKWVVEIVETGEYNGYMLPSKCTVTWKLPEGDFNWLELEIDELDFNNLALY